MIPDEVSMPWFEKAKVEKELPGHGWHVLDEPVNIYKSSGFVESGVLVKGG